jgi:hypothetical protein
MPALSVIPGGLFRDFSIRLREMTAERENCEKKALIYSPDISFCLVTLAAK